MLRLKYKAPLSIKSPEPRAKGDVDIRGGNYGKGLNKQDVNLTDRLLAGGDCCSLKLTLKKEQEGEGVQAEVWIYNIYNPSPRSPRLINSLSTLP